MTTQGKRTEPKQDTQDSRKGRAPDDAHARQAPTGQTVADRRGDQHPSSKKPDRRDG